MIRSQRTKPRRRAGVYAVLVLGILLLAGAAIFPTGVVSGVLSCSNALFCVSLEGVLTVGGVSFLSAFNALRKNDQPKIRTIRIALAVALPVGAILGIFFGDIFTPPLPSPDRIVAAGQGVLTFDSFLTVGWTIAFTLVGNWLNEMRALRRQVIEIGRVSKSDFGDILNDLKSLSLSAFVEVAAGIFLIIISAFFALAAILVAGPISLMLALIFLGVGASSMVIGWYDLYSRTELAMSIVDSAPKPPPSSEPSSSKSSAQ